eukprot:gb/GFBE01012958.1/.p1 GENE.gb/GFBE01012958.1/~~gb/GFBE01012958.1/.p1  ORF type:complete len:425 (+),score=64.11 gb/GFBE01012958.1/:1-1275(+)
MARSNLTWILPLLLHLAAGQTCVEPDKSSKQCLLQSKAARGKVALSSALGRSHGDLLREGLARTSLHKDCTPLNVSGVSFTEAEADQTLKNINWLHVPKTGTSFISTIWNYACGQHEPPLDLEVDAYATATCSECYDFALMGRYPVEQYCTPGVLSSNFGTQHAATTLDKMLAGENVVSILRRPNQRLISAYHARHVSGFGDVETELWMTCSDAACFARFPGVAGCMTRMLTGGTCADSLQQTDLADRADQAVEALQHLAFVGLTEEWDESVCLFHVMFGGSMNSAELKDVHMSRGSADDYDESELDGFVDDADEKVYAAAQARFNELKKQYVGGGSACDFLTQSGKPSPLQLVEARSDICSCGGAGMECGQMDGLDCGMCPLSRLTGDVWATEPPAGTNLTCSSAGKCLVNGEHTATFTWYVR